MSREERNSRRDLSWPMVIFQHTGRDRRSFGEGGGQILRSSLALSLLTQKPFRITNIRANRAKPGLRRRHWRQCERRHASDARRSMAQRLIHLNSHSVQARRRRASSHVQFGSAGSTTLVFQTVLPALLLADGPSVLRFVVGRKPRRSALGFSRSGFSPRSSADGRQAHRHTRAARIRARRRRRVDGSHSAIATAWSQHPSARARATPERPSTCLEPARLDSTSGDQHGRRDSVMAGELRSRRRARARQHRDDRRGIRELGRDGNGVRATRRAR